VGSVGGERFRATRRAPMFVVVVVVFGVVVVVIV